MNDGTLRKTAGSGAVLLASMNILNRGTINAESGTLYLQTDFFDNADGTLEVDNGRLQFSQPLDLRSGLIKGSGTIEAPSVISSGIVRPGSTGAVLIISGDYTQQLAGMMECDIAGNSPESISRKSK